MKRILIILLVLALLVGGVVVFLATRSMGFSTGRCLVVDADTVMLIRDNSPIVMHPRASAWMLEGLATGDEILVLHDGIQESYPGGTGVYLVYRMGGGTIADIPPVVIEQLTELGWLS